ncbi:HAMP domain-containing histidine kinase [Clostridium perfringens]|uniref:sensor histidine kinase n=1 Tax=Clostridium perfringens TaxID=1502 RepID=UPI000F53CC35|nr:HAMP domain-containing sensor histidine kinase [Clostridium perfringens]EGT3607597.1 HAMP domain-containing histidine kinase [Clostridium perfringens]EJT6340315.1 HAMP domain-containing histidine kinase [Clostridium perfringens]ELQ0170459.1 HAMP domain-containing histidine kinase [Clostridium perfringens]MDU7723868.1 HAMP domain-containing sensor histidine kinase [Clostridium perfringens]UBL00167.1 HAMP domain-containing histidine kinase [Clostridium perfringens]
MKSIKTRLMKNFLVLLLSTIIIVSAMFLIFISRYYYQNTEEILLSQINISVDFYKRYLSNVSLEENVYEDVDIFWKQTDAQVQIYNLKGQLIMDSIGLEPKEYNTPVDVKRALEGDTAKWVGTVPDYTGKVMAISAPLRNSSNEIVGVIRYISSLRNVDNFILNFFLVFLVIGLTVLAIGIILSYFLANSIVNPITELIKVSEQMAKGNLKVRNKIVTNDEIEKLADSLNIMAEEIENREILKNEFISSVSHELRTPLTSIKGWAITLNNDFTDRETLKMGFDIIEKEADRLSNMVEELLDFSKFVSGKIKLKYEEINLKEFIEYLRLYMNPRAEREHKELILEGITEDFIIVGDKDRLKQVFINIIDNAFKFTHENEKITIEFVYADEGIYINIIDTGCGISKEELPRVKEKFYKGKNSKSQNGIGLSICDEIIALHEGTLEIYSELGKGTKVVIYLPKKLIRSVEDDLN